LDLPREPTGNRVSLGEGFGKSIRWRGDVKGIRFNWGKLCQSLWPRGRIKRKTVEKQAKANTKVGAPEPAIPSFVDWRGTPKKEGKEILKKKFTESRGRKGKKRGDSHMRVTELEKTKRSQRGRTRDGEE